MDRGPNLGNLKEISINRALITELCLIKAPSYGTAYERVFVVRPTGGNTRIQWHFRA